MSKIQDVPFITKVIDTLSDELKSGLYDLIDGQVKTPVFRSLVNNDYAITEANDKGKVQFVTLETLRGNYTGYLAYNSVYCVLIAFKGNTQALDMLNINVAKHTFAFVNESLSILELRVELEDGKEGVTPTDLGVTNNNIHLAKGTTQIGEGVNLKTLDGNTLVGSGDIDLKTVGGETIVGSGNVGFKTINGVSIMGDGNIVVGEGGTIAIDTAFDETSTNPVQNKVIAKFANEVVENKANVDGNYQTMTVGNADNANNLIATKGLEVESYFTFEKTGGEQASAIESGNGTLKNLYGKTEKSENLLIYSDVAETTFSGTLKYKIVGGAIILNGQASESKTISIPLTTLIPAGDYYAMPFAINYNENNGVALAPWADVTYFGNSNVGRVVTVSSDRTVLNVYVNASVTYTNAIIYPMLVKGSTAPTTWSQGYTGLKHTHITGFKTTGINLWDEEWRNGFYDISTGAFVSYSGFIANKNQIRVKPSTTYYFNCQSSYVDTYVCEYDMNGNFIGRRGLVINSTFTTQANTEYINFMVQGTTYNHDICINISDATINGNYYPYEEETLDIDFEGNGVGTASDEINVEEKKHYKWFDEIDLENISFTYEPQNNLYHSTSNILPNAKLPSEWNTQVSNIISPYYTAIKGNPTTLETISLENDGKIRICSSSMPKGKLVYELSEPIVTDVEIPNDTIKVWNGGSMEALGTEVPVGTKIFYQKNIKAFVEAFGEAIDWNPERIERLAKLSITPEYVNISLNPSQANAYAVAQVYNATFTIVISTALTGTPNGEITFQDSEIDLSSFETQPAESIYDMDGKKVSEEPTTTDCNIASFVGRSYNGIVLWSLLHSGVNKVKVHFEQSIPLDSEGNGKLDCRASLIL